MLAVWAGGTALLFAIMLWDVSRPSSSLALAVFAFFVGAPVLGCAVALAASGRALPLLLGLAMFVASAIVMGIWMGSIALNEGGGYFVGLWLVLQTGAMYATAGVMAFVRLLARPLERAPEIPLPEPGFGAREP